jgi:hypothetical protein
MTNGSAVLMRPSLQASSPLALDRAFSASAHPGMTLDLEAA